MTWLQRTVTRCLEDMRLTSIVLLGTLASLVILPFAVFRAWHGEWVAATVDATLVLVLAACVVYSLRTGKTTLTGLVITVMVSIGCVVMTALTGVAGVFWMFTVLIANFMLTRPAIALCANLSIIAVAPLVPEVLPAAAIPVFLVTTGLVSVYAFAFAWLTDRQRGALELLATRDPLTGVPNRRVMEVELAEIVATHHDSAWPAAIAVLDLDHFKRVNDEHGHDAGDRVLVAFAEIVGQCIRKRDRLFRFGGEEFILLLPCTDAEGMRTALAKVHENLRMQLRGPAGPVRTSIGAALLQPGDNWPAWLARADAALYCAKRNGRNRICVDGAGLPGEQRRSCTEEYRHAV